MSARIVYPTVSSRIDAISKVFSLERDKVLKMLQDGLGVSEDDMGTKILDAVSTTEEDIVVVLGHFKGFDLNFFKIRAIAAILKGWDPFDNSKEQPKPEVSPATVESKSEPYSALIEALRTPQQMSDSDLLQAFIKTRDSIYEQELNKRASGNHFIVLKPGTEEGNQEIDVEMSLDLLKRARKMTTPSMLPYKDKIVQIYRITQLNMEDRIVELCPFCDEIMYKGYCQACNADFSGVGDDERAYVRLVSEHESFNRRSFADRRAVLVSAMIGVEDLRKTWPGVSIKHRELKMTNSLPKLRKLRDLPSFKPADPFHVKG